MRNETVNFRSEFFLGAFVGGLLTMAVILSLIALFPHDIKSVNEQLIKEGLAYRSPITGEPVWKECKK
jgi:hypothetical protein